MLCIILACCAIVSAFIGLFYSTGGTEFFVNNVYGQQVELYGDGIYAYNSMLTVSSRLGADWMGIFGAAFLIFLCIKKPYQLWMRVLKTAQVTMFIYYFAIHIILCCTNGYIAKFILYETGRLLSSASANIMRFIQDGVEKKYIQIGTVMTAKDCRNKGYASELIYKIIEDYKDKVDGIYLFSNLDSLKFYEKLSFTQGLQYRYYLKPEIVIDRKPNGYERVLPDNNTLVQLYRNMIKESISYCVLF